VSASGGNGHSGGSGGRIMMNATRASLLIQPITTNNMVAVGGIDLCTAQSGASKSVTQAGAAGTKFLNLKGDSAILASKSLRRPPLLVMYTQDTPALD